MFALLVTSFSLPVLFTACLLAALLYTRLKNLHFLQNLSKYVLSLLAWTLILLSLPEEVCQRGVLQAKGRSTAGKENRYPGLCSPHVCHSVFADSQ